MSFFLKSDIGNYILWNIEEMLTWTFIALTMVRNIKYLILDLGGKIIIWNIIII